MLASARPVPGLYSAASELRLGDHHGILMAYNGGKVVDATDGQLLSQTHMDLNKTRELLRFLEALPVTVILDDGERFYVEDAHGYKVEYECWNNQMDCTEVDNLADFLDFSPVKLLLSVDPDEILNIQDMIRSHLPDDLCVVRTAPFYLEIIPVSINKGKALFPSIREKLFLMCAAAFVSIRLTRQHSVIPKMTFLCSRLPAVVLPWVMRKMR